MSDDEDCDCPDCVGPQGYIGSQGADSYGYQGPRGIQGDISIGNQGPIGYQGTDQFGPQGFDGPQGWQGMNPNSGFQGPQGPQGVSSLAGSQGPEGNGGAMGFQAGIGAQGSQGPTESAARGPQGYAGSQGDPTPGPAGPDAVVLYTSIVRANSSFTITAFPFRSNITTIAIPAAGTYYLRFNTTVKNLTTLDIFQVGFTLNGGGIILGNGAQRTISPTLGQSLTIFIIVTVTSAITQAEVTVLCPSNTITVEFQGYTLICQQLELV